MDFVSHDDDRGILGVAADHAQPILRVRVLPPVSAVQHQEIQAAFRQEKLVRVVHDLLPAEIPDIQRRAFASPERQGPGRDGDALGDGFVLVEFLVGQTLDQGRFADRTEPDQDQTCLVQRSPALSVAEIIGQDIGWIGWLSFLSDGVARCCPEQCGRQVQVGIVVQI